jgi:Protein of unknown function (DUF3631)
MNGRRAMVRRFGDGDRERLEKLFRQLGTDNPHEAEAARSRIASLLRQFDKSWSDLVELLSSGTLIIDPTLGDIAGLGDPDPDQRAIARRNLLELLALHRKSWNDLADALCAVTSAVWLNSRSDDPERVNPLGLIVHLLQDYLEFREPHEYVAVALWALHTHVSDHFMVTPRLALRSPVAGCGKTVLIDVLAKLVAKPAKFDSVTAAAIYHLIDETHPTLLIDEADNLTLGLQANGRIRAVFNSGHRKGGTVAIRDRGETRKFLVFAPLALALPDAMVGLPRTLNSRCITLNMQRSDGRRELRRFDVNHPDPALDVAYRQILLWRRDLDADALNPEPEMPSTIRNRLADNWRPLISIADNLGWGEQARDAMLKFAAEFQDADARITLLDAIRKVFDACGLDRISSHALLDELNVLNDADWKEFLGIRGEQQPHRLKDSELASMLRDFRIKPSTIWPLNRTTDSKSAKGYRRSQFEAVWRAYCADGDTAAHASKVKSLRL